MLAPVLFNIYVQCVTRLLSGILDQHHQISLNYRTDRSLFDLQKLKSKTKISQTKLLEFQYADDCAVVADSPESLQEVLSHMAVLYKKLGLNINVQKTEFLKRTVSSPESPITLNIDGTELNEVQCFRYLNK